MGARIVEQVRESIRYWTMRAESMSTEERKAQVYEYVAILESELARLTKSN